MVYKTLGKTELENVELIASFTPNFTEKRKREFFGEARKIKEKSLTGSVTVTRCTPDDDFIDSAVFTKKTTVVKDEAGFFNYAKDQSNSERCVWWMNFADPKLFGYYSGSMFAQDEIQVFEHPVLAGIRNYLVDPGEENMQPWTLTLRDGEPDRATPFLIENVPMWLKVDTCPQLPFGGFGHIYGRSFRSASYEELEAGIKVVKENIKNNIMAVSAVVGSGLYTYDQIEIMLKTLICAFSKAKDVAQGKKCVIHGGNWGCGAFGGNPEVMYFLQIYAASVTGIDELILHNTDDDAYFDAKEVYDDLDDETTLESVIYKLLDKEYCWGRGDGN